MIGVIFRVFKYNEFEEIFKIILFYIIISYNMIHIIHFIMKLHNILHKLYEAIHFDTLNKAINLNPKKNYHSSHQ